MNRLTLEQRDLLAVATFLALACWATPAAFASAICGALIPEAWWHHYNSWGAEYLTWLILALFGLVLVLPSPRRHGLRIGSVSRTWPWILGFWVAVVGVWWAIVAAFRLSLFPGSTAAIWALSPLGQDLVFVGFLYTRFDEAFPGNVSPRLPIRWAVLLPAIFFALCHVPNMLHGGVVWLALLPVTMLLYVGQALSRQLTGSMVYATVAHMAGNFVTWWYSQWP